MNNPKQAIDNALGMLEAHGIRSGDVYEDLKAVKDQITSPALGTREDFFVQVLATVMPGINATSQYPAFITVSQPGDSEVSDVLLQLVDRRDGAIHDAIYLNDFYAAELAVALTRFLAARRTE